MAIELRGNVDPAIQARLNDLDVVNHGQAQLLANQFNSGAINAGILDSRIQQAYSKVTASNTGAAFNTNAARFASVSPIRAEKPSTDAASAIELTAGLDLSNPTVSESRPRIIDLITRATA